MSGIVFGYGCPRSGTTFLQHCIQRIPGVLAQKIGEGSMLHPCRSTDGLHVLSHLFAQKKLVIVRIVRDPVEVASSFFAARMFNKDDPKQYRGLAKNSDWDVVQFIRSESLSTASQWQHFRGNKWGHRLVEVRYEELASEEYRRTKAEEVCGPLGVDPGPLTKAFGQWGKAPARVGRLSEGKDPVSKAQRGRFATWLQDTIKREGYE